MAAARRPFRSACRFRIESPRAPPEYYMKYPNILVDTRGRVALITLNRPKVLNALNDALMNELGHALARADAAEAVGALVLTGRGGPIAARAPGPPPTRPWALSS